MTNRISSDVKLKLYQALPQQRLIRLANTFGLAGSGSSHAKLAQAMVEASDRVVLTFINSHLDFLELKELRGIAKKLGVGSGARDYETLASEVEEFIRGARSAATEVLAGDHGVTFEQLWEEAERLAKPTVHLQWIDRPKKSQPRAAIWSETELEIDGRQHWLTVDLRHHPDKALQADGILQVFANWGEKRGYARFSPEQQLPRARRGQVTLHAVSEWDFPSSDVLLLKAKSQIKRWRDKIGWQPSIGATEDVPALDLYDEEWAYSHPSQQFQGGEVYAQLGGWSIGWPEESAAEQVRRKLVLRTYADSEPWLEVFKRGQSYEVMSRIT